MKSNDSVKKIESNCCDDFVRVEPFNDINKKGRTLYFVCNKCNKPCDTHDAKFIKK